jgi:ribulose-5-phosphate 4-epimerase/fuculose-1-phosphate aldolase
MDSSTALLNQPGGDTRAGMSDAEWRMRVDLAACFRLTAMFGWDDLIYSRITARVPGEPEHFLINPFGLMFEEVTASCLIKIDRHARPVQPTNAEVNPEGFVPMIAMHDARSDVNCVLHTHTLAGTAISIQPDGLQPLTQIALFDIGYHPYEGYPLREAEKQRLRVHLGQADAMIMQAHGLVTIGRTVAQAFLTMRRLELACQTQLLAQQTGAPLLRVSHEALDYINTEGRVNTVSTVGPELAWGALLRKLDRCNPGYDD